MIKIHKEIQKDYYLIELEGTNYLQIWNKFDLYETLIEAKKKITLRIEDTPISEEDLNTLVEDIKQFKQIKQNGKK
jgi:hypothetical protein